MALLAKTPVLEWNRDPLCGDEFFVGPFGDGVSKPYPLAVCRDEVMRLFNLPPSAKRVRFFAHDEPAADRVKIELPSDRSTVDRQLLVNEDVIVFSDRAFDELAELLNLHDAVYVSCWYEQ